MDFHALGWNEGEDEMHKLLHVPHMHNPTSPGLSPHSQRMLHISSLLAIGVVDDQGRPWTNVLGGEPGFARSFGQSIVGVQSLADLRHDPVMSILFSTKQEDVQGRQVRDFSALGIHLATRDRVKLQGKVLAAGSKGGDQTSEHAVGETQIALSITGSIGNCPKYLNKKDIVLTTPAPVVVSDQLPLSEGAVALIAQADLFFLTSFQPSHMSTNHRGGPPGFVRVAKNDASGTILVYPEYSGNRLYQTLGNLRLDPRAGIAIPDFNTGNILYLTCTAKILFGEAAASTLPRSNLAVQLLVTSARLVEKGLGFRGSLGERSPYNPPVRFLSNEKASSTDAQANSDGKTAYAKLLSRTLLSPTIARFKFSISDPAMAGTWTPGQYVALAFEDELSGGYAHMNDDDPKSLNDDYIRTFTVSSPPRASGCGGDIQHDEFEITIRNVGKVTGFLFKANIRAGLELPLKGFSGTFSIVQAEDGDEVTPFVAGGIGITPLLAQMQRLDLQPLMLLWTVNLKDIGFVLDTFERCPELARSARVFISNLSDRKGIDTDLVLAKIRDLGVQVTGRRLTKEDLDEVQGSSNTWYLCTGPALRKSLLGWLEGKMTVYEDFDY